MDWDDEANAATTELNKKIRPMVGMEYSLSQLKFLIELEGDSAKTKHGFCAKFEIDGLRSFYDRASGRA